MSLVEAFYETLTILERRTTPDAYGGFTTEWVEGASFKGAVTTEATTEQRVAEKALGAVSYKVTVPRNVTLSYGDIVKRADESYLKITSDSQEVRTPSVAGFSFAQSTAERWELK